MKVNGGKFGKKNARGVVDYKYYRVGNKVDIFKCDDKVSTFVETRVFATVSKAKEFIANV